MLLMFINNVIVGSLSISLVDRARNLYSSKKKTPLHIFTEYREGQLEIFSLLYVYFVY